MEQLADLGKLQEFAALLAPGLIISTLRASVRAGSTVDLKDRAVLWAAMSAVYYAAAYPLFHWPHGLVVTSAIWSLLQYVVVPTVCGLTLAFEAQDDWLRHAAAAVGLRLAQRYPASWDYAFSDLIEGTFVLVTLKDGSQVAGLIGGSSFASSSETERDLLIESVWIITDGGAWTQAQPPRAILICGGEIGRVEIFVGE